MALELSREQVKPLSCHARKSSPHHFAAIGVVVAIHIAWLWAMVAGIRVSPAVILSHELEVRLISPNLGPEEAYAPPLDWQFQDPQMPLVPEPEINIAPDRQARPRLKWNNSIRTARSRIRALITVQGGSMARWGEMR